MPKLPSGLRHAFWSLADTAIYPVLYMATVPLLIRYMGPVVFGFWIVLNTMITILQLFNFNFGFTALRHVSYERASGQPATVTAIINSLLRITFLQWAGVVALGAIVAALMASTGWLGNYAATFRYGSLCFLLAAVLAGFKYFEQLFQNVFKAYEHFRAAAILNMISRFGSLAVTIILAAIYNAGILYVLLGNIVFSACYLLLHYFYLHRVLPFYSHVQKGGRALQKSLLHYSMWPWVQSVIVVLTFQADRFWVSGYAGLKEVSAYGLVATMFNHIHMIFMAMVVWILPRIIGWHAKGYDTAPLYTITRSALTVITIVSLLLFYVLSPWLFSVWVGNATYLSMKGYIQAFTGFELVYVHSIMPLFYLNGTGKERIATYTTLGYCLLCYALMLSGLWFSGSPVVLVQGMTLGVCLAMPLFNILVQRAMKEPVAIKDIAGELVPVYAAIALVYMQQAWVGIGISIAAGWLLWKYYLVHIFNRKSWMQIFNA